MAGSEDLCGCCDGIGAETPAEVWNRPGLPAVAYRVGEHGSFKASMLARLSSTAYPALNGLTPRDDSDLSIALLDAAATVGEILTFYQERIANESYLATATRWRALASMGRLTGYEPRAGLAATAALAFTLDDAAGAPEETDIPAGTRVQSIPAAGAMPQAFETSAVFTGRPEWNGMRPVTMQAQPTPTASTQSLTVQGLATGVRRGDLLLITTGSTPVVRQVLAATPDQPTGTTRLDLSGSPEPPPTYVPPPLPILRIFDFEETLLTNSEMRRSVLGYRWAQPDLRAFATTKRWSVPQLRRAAAALAAPTPPPAGIFRFRQTGAIFGHNAPRADQLTSTPNPPSLDDWDAGVQDYPGSRVNELWEGLHKLPARSRTIQLDRVYDGVVPGSWALLAELDPVTGLASAVPFGVGTVTQGSVAAFTLAAKVTQLDLGLPTDSPSAFTRRGTTVHVESEALTLAPLPVAGPLTGGLINLDGLFLGLSDGQKVTVTGARDDLEDATTSEVSTITSAVMLGSVTQITIDPPLAGSYKLGSVTVNANTVAATHGLTRDEVIGSGDASTPFQVFALTEPPLTYVADATGGGTRSTLEVRVNGILWVEAAMLFGAGPRDRIFITWRGSDGRTRVGFGDGITGARLPTGTGNVTAHYRAGIGSPGLVDAGALALLLTRPLGVRSVTNPVPTSDAADPESAESLRQTAPLHVLTLDRVVSLADYENYARAFPGVAKAMARWSVGSRGRTVVVTLAGAGGAPIDPAGALGTSLIAALKARGDPTIGVALGRYVRVFFRIDGSLRIDPSMLRGDVMQAVETTLRQTFSIDSRGFGQGVYRSEIVAAIHGVQGVVAFDLNALTFVGRLYGFGPLRRLDGGMGSDLRIIRAVPPDPLPAAVPAAGAPADARTEILLLDPRPLAFGAMA